MLAVAFGANAQPQGKLVVKRGAVDTVYKAKHQVLGLADPAARVQVNGENVKVYKTGTWGVELQLKEGNNAIEVVSGSENKKFNVFYSTTPKERKRDLAREAAEAEKAKFYPTSVKVSTKK